MEDNTKTKAGISKSNVKGFLQAHYRKMLDGINFLPEYIKEQAKWRLQRVEELSPQCYKEDICVHCGCVVSDKVFEDRECHGKPSCYPPMMNLETWILFKKTLNINLDEQGNSI